MTSSRLLARLALVLGAPVIAIGAASSLQACGGDSGGGDASSCKRPAPTPVTGTVAEPFCRTLADCQVPENRRGQMICTSEESAVRGCGDRGPTRPTCNDDLSCQPQTGTGGTGGTGGAGGTGPMVNQVCQETDGAPRYCEPPCISDAGCAAHRQCETSAGHCLPRPCGGSAGECPSSAFCAPAGACEIKRCDPASATSCAAPGYSCSPTTYDCVATPCAADPDCPDTFRCEGGACARRTCACDNECGASGYCLKGICAETLGHCSGIAMCGRPLLVAGAPVVAARVWSADWSA